MIRIRRPKSIPAILVEEGTQRRAEHCAAIAEDPASTLKFDARIYGAPDVKAALVRAQHGKCCFCESKVRHVAPGDVEHFRPKAAVYLDADARLSKPGYYWLAYEWTNLLFACEECNRRGKRNRFPLQDETKRARHPLASLRDEDPVFVDPSAEDPAQHIGFRQELAYGLTDRGAETLAALGLNRDPLATARAERLDYLRVLAGVVRLYAASRARTQRKLVADARRILKAAVGSSGEYAAMCRGAAASGTM